jgi:hypothetical protein
MLRKVDALASGKRPRGSAMLAISRPKKNKFDLSRFLCDCGSRFRLIISSVNARAQQTNVELIIDDSGSMAQRIEGKSKIAIAKEDPMDVFKFKVDGGKTYQFKARPAKSSGSIDVSVVDDDGNDLGKASSPNKGW